MESPAITERFLWDLRRTVSDLIAENFFRPFAQLCRRHGLESMVEPYYGPFESMICGAQVDIPMAEFWQVGYNTEYSCTEMASAAHAYGKPILGADIWLDCNSSYEINPPGANPPSRPSAPSARIPNGSPSGPGSRYSYGWLQGSTVTFFVT